jgi:hypothetical protein
MFFTLLNPLGQFRIQCCQLFARNGILKEEIAVSMKIVNQTFIVLHIKPPNRIMNQTQEKIKKNLMAD